MKSKFIAGLLFCTIVLSNHGFAKPSCGHENTKAVYLSDFDSATNIIEINSVESFDSVYAIEINFVESFDYVYTIETDSTIEVTAAEFLSAEKHLVNYFEFPDYFVRDKYSGDTNIHYLCSASFISNRTEFLKRSGYRRNLKIKPMFEHQNRPGFRVRRHKLE